MSLVTGTFLSVLVVFSAEREGEGWDYLCFSLPVLTGCSS